MWFVCVGKSLVPLLGYYEAIWIHFEDKFWYNYPYFCRLVGDSKKWNFGNQTSKIVSSLLDDLIKMHELDSLGLHKTYENPNKNLHWIWDKTRQISGQTDEYSPTKKIKQFRTQTNLPFGLGSDE